MNKILNLLIQFSSKQTLWILSFGWIVILASMLFYPNGILDLYKAGGNHIIPDLTFYYGTSDLQILFDNWQAEGLMRYSLFHKIDMIYPFYYALLLCVIMIRSQALKHFKWCLFIPFIAALFDVLENIFLEKCVDLYPTIDAGLTSMASTQTNLKWLALLGSMFIIIYSLLMKGRPESDKIEE